MAVILELEQLSTNCVVGCVIHSSSCHMSKQLWCARTRCEWRSSVNGFGIVKLEKRRPFTLYSDLCS